MLLRVQLLDEPVILVLVILGGARQVFSPMYRHSSENHHIPEERQRKLTRAVVKQPV